MQYRKNILKIHLKIYIKYIFGAKKYTKNTVKIYCKYI